MSLSDLLRAVSIREDADSAKAFASLLNADRTTIRLLEGRSHFTAEDVLRLGRIVSEYTPANSADISSMLADAIGEQTAKAEDKPVVRK